MSVVVRIPTPLRALTSGQGQVTLDATSVKDLLQRLDEAHAGLRERLCEQDGAIRRFVNIYVNEEDIRFLQGTDTALKPGDEVSIVPAMAGGCCGG